MRAPALLLAAILALPGAAAAQSDGAIRYQPPTGDQAPRRVGANVRGLPAMLPAVSVLAPDHLGLTISERPTLYWYLSAPTAARIEVVVVDPRSATPVLDTVVSGDRAGVQAVELAARGVRLEPGVAYEWSVAIVADPAQRSRDIVAGGAVMRVAPPDALRGLAASPPERRAAALAAAGIWYDALAALSGDGVARGARAVLLEQAGLADAAAFERSR